MWPVTCLQASIEPVIFLDARWMHGFKLTDNNFDGVSVKVKVRCEWHVSEVWFLSLLRRYVRVSFSTVLQVRSEHWQMEAGIEASSVCCNVNPRVRSFLLDHLLPISTLRSSHEPSSHDISSSNMFLHFSTWNSEEVQVKRPHLFSKIDTTTLFLVDISRQRADFA